MKIVNKSSSIELKSRAALSFTLHYWKCAVAAIEVTTAAVVGIREVSIYSYVFIYIYIILRKPFIYGGAGRFIKSPVQGPFI